jgi:hypothetical protein
VQAATTFVIGDETVTETMTVVIGHIYDAPL